jgi:hypothetical protein
MACGCLLVIALLAQSVAAQTVYKSTMKDGSVIFSDRPEPDAVKVETSRPNTSDTGVQVVSPDAEDRLQEMEAAREEGQAVADERREAEEALRKAEEALANGKEPLPDERIGTAGGTSRLTDSYWARQSRLEQDVIKAREKLNQR